MHFLLSGWLTYLMILVFWKSKLWPAAFLWVVRAFEWSSSLSARLCSYMRFLMGREVSPIYVLGQVEQGMAYTQASRSVVLVGLVIIFLIVVEVQVVMGVSGSLMLLAIM